MRNEFLPFCLPAIGDEEIAEVVETLRAGWITTGPKVKQFEEEFAKFVDARAALAVNSCTAALHLALVTLGIGPGDAVITTPMTFCSTVHVIEQVGARPVLVDVEPDTLNIDPHKVREILDKATGGSTELGRVRAIIPVHLYGHPCHLDALFEIAKEFNLAIIEDAAHALPARYKQRIIGSFAASAPIPVLTCFSFYATKNLTTAEGGMLSGPRELIEEARIWSLHGMGRDAWKRYGSGGSWYYEVIHPGFKYNMTDIQAAIGLHQLRKLPKFYERRREIVRRYNAAFSRLKEFQIPNESRDVQHAWHLYVLRLNGAGLDLARDEFIEGLTMRKVGTSVHFIPIHLLAYYREKYGYAPQDFPVAYREFQRIVSLPLYPAMDDQDVENVIAAVQAVVESLKARVV